MRWYTRLRAIPFGGDSRIRRQSIRPASLFSLMPASSVSRNYTTRIINSSTLTICSRWVSRRGNTWPMQSHVCCFNNYHTPFLFLQCGRKGFHCSKVIENVLLSDDTSEFTFSNPTGTLIKDTKKSLTEAFYLVMFSTTVPSSPLHSLQMGVFENLVNGVK